MQRRTFVVDRSWPPKMLLSTLVSTWVLTLAAAVPADAQVNTPPVAHTDAATTPEDTAVVIDPIANDTDADGDPLSLAVFHPILEDPLHGTAVKIASTLVEYSPEAGFTGVDSFRYRVVDPNGGFSSAIVTVTVGAPNTPPIAYPDVATTPEDTAVVIDPVANDVDPNGDPLTLAVFHPILEDPLHGTAVKISSTLVQYTPFTDFFGTDQFRYRVVDPNGGFTSAIVTVTVTPVNDRPQAVDDGASTHAGQPVDVVVTANDTDPDGDPVMLISQPIVVAPQDGTATRLSNTTIRYLPAMGFTGTDTFQYEVGDGNGRRDRAWVTVSVGNNPPVAVDDIAAAAPGISARIEVTANDSDPDGDPVLLISNPVIVLPSGGTAVRVSNTAIEYTADATFSGTDSFQYEIGDGFGRRDRAWVTVTVANQPPVAVDDTATTAVDTRVDIDVLGNDHDPDGHAIALSAASIVAGPSGGIAVRTSDSSIRYTPNVGFLGEDTFEYRIEDALGLGATARVTVTVTEAPEPVVDDVTPDLIPMEAVTRVTVHGSYLRNATVTVGTAPFDPGAPPRVFPTARIVNINPAATRIEVEIDASDPAIEGFYGLVVETSSGAAAGHFRVIPDHPVIDVFTPSEAVEGHTYVLSIVGVNLSGAEVFPTNPNVQLLDLENSDDRDLVGLLYVAGGGPLGLGDLEIRRHGFATRLPLEVVGEPSALTKQTVSVDDTAASGDGRAGGAGDSAIYLQDPTPLTLGQDIFGDDESAPGDDTSSASSPFTFCIMIRRSARRTFHKVLVRFFDDSNHPLALSALNALVPNSRLNFSATVLSVSGFIEASFRLRICNGEPTDIEFCIRGTISFMIPLVGGQQFSFVACFGGGSQSIQLAASGALFNFSWSTSNGCVQARDLDPLSQSGIREEEIEMTCCANADLGLNIRGVTFGREFDVGGPVFEVEPDQCEVPGPGLRIFLDADRDNFYLPNQVTQLVDLDDLERYLPCSETGTLRGLPPASLPQQMILVAAFVEPRASNAVEIVEPPSGVTEAHFALIEVSAFQGRAMNFGSEIGRDFFLGSSNLPVTDQTAAFNAGHVAEVQLSCDDYGGFTTVFVEAGGSEATVRIPIEATAGLLPEIGWHPHLGPPVTGSLDPAADSDIFPLGSTGAGDGLSNYEEYRGFMVRGQHRRTDPTNKDVFISSDLSTGISFADTNLPLVVHRVFGQDETAQPEYGFQLEINFNILNFGSGGNVPGLTGLQKALRVIDWPGPNVPGQFSLGRTFSTPGQPLSPNSTIVIHVFVDQITAVMTQILNLPQAVDLEIQHTTAHEIGHGVGITVDKAFFDCMSQPPSDWSIMNQGAACGAGRNAPPNQYDANDRAQIRLH